MNPSIFVYYHTHWDREWYLPFREYQHRLLGVVDDVLDALESGRLPCFTLDGQTVLLEDYLEFRASQRPRLERLIREEALSIGPWYVMPDEFLVSGESLIRNLQRGLALSERFGETTFTGYIPDTFGHSADIPMLLRQFGIETAILWRGVAPESTYFHWDSPSGDRVLTLHLTHGYFQNVFHMGRDEAEKKSALETWLSGVSPLAVPGLPLLYPLGADHLGVAWEAPAHLQSDGGPRVEICTPDRFMRDLPALNGTRLAVHTGELREFGQPYLLPGVFSSRMYLKQWNRRLEWRLTRQLEQLLSWQQVPGKTPLALDELDFCWKTLLLNHPHDSICGCSVDSVHRENESRFEQIAQLSDALLRECHQALREARQQPGALFVLNLGDRPYTGTVEITQDYPLEYGPPTEWPHAQVLSETPILDERYLLDASSLALSDNRALRRTFLIWADSVPAHGTLNLPQTVPAPDAVTVTDKSLRNAHLHVEVAADGSLRITEAATGQTLPGVHALIRQDEQGDSYNAAPVPGTLPEPAVLVESVTLAPGPLRGSLKLTCRFERIGMDVETVVSLDAGSPRLTFETTYVNNTPDQKIQALFPARDTLTEVLAEGHFAPVTRASDPEYHIAAGMPAPKFRELRVQGGPIQRFIAFSKQTLLTEGLTEYETVGKHVHLTLLRAFGMLSRDDTGVRGSHAGPPLATPEGQCLNRVFIGRYAWLPGEDVATAFDEADRFYGAVYGMDALASAPGRPESAEARPAAWSFLAWDNPNIQSTALTPLPEGQWELRLLNPTAVPQALTLAGSGVQDQAIAGVTLRGDVIDAHATGILAIPPYQIRTLRVSPR